MRKCMSIMREWMKLLLLFLLSALVLTGCGGPGGTPRREAGRVVSTAPEDSGGERAPQAETGNYDVGARVEPPAEEGPEHLPTDGGATPEGSNLPADPETPPGPPRLLDGAEE